MRLRRAPAAWSNQAPTSGGGAGVAVSPDGGLQGSWSATRWQYTSRRDSEKRVDVVCELRGSVTLSLSAGTYVLAWDIPGGPRQSVGGAYAVRQDAIDFTASASDQGESVAFRLGTEELTLRSEASAWDFHGDGQEEPASFVAVFVKL